MGKSTVLDSFFCGEFFLLVILFSAEWLKTSCIGKRRKREKKTNGRGTNKKQGGVSSDSIYCTSLDFPWSFPVLLGQELALPLSFQLVFWGSGSCADSQVCAPGELPSPLPGTRLCGSCLSCEAPAQCQIQGDTRRNNSGSSQLSNSGVSSCSNHCSSQSAGAWMLRGWGAQICTIWGAQWQECSLSYVLLASTCPRGSAGSWAVSPSTLGSGVDFLALFKNY